jgi:dolichyl-phosphate beta-glucosyltransferase
MLPGCRDTQAGLKGFTATAAEFLFSEMRLTGFSFDVEILFLAQHHSDFKIREIPVQFCYREELSTVDFLEDAFRLICDLVRIRYWSVRGRYNDFVKTGAHEEARRSCG